MFDVGAFLAVIVPGGWICWKLVPRIVYNVESETRRSNWEAWRRPKQHVDARIVYRVSVDSIVKKEKK